MSFNMRLKCETCGTTKHNEGRHSEGGTFTIGGTSEADLNVTYNYSKLMADVGCHRSDLDGKRAGDTIPQLEAAVARLGTERDGDYWAPTEGNVGYTLNVLLGWAKSHPNAIWEEYGG